MGNQLVRAVSDHWGHLPAGPYKLLVRMASYSLDTSTDPAKPPAHYWRGWPHLAEALGRKVPEDDGTPESTRRRETLKREVRKHTNELVRLGAVQRAVENPGRGTRQVWKLTL
jgi:hypothetical protein